MTKNDQTGEGYSKEKHVAANPLIPEIYPILSLAVLFWSQKRNVNEPRQQVFLGLADDARFFRILHSVINAIPPHVDLGANRGDIGATHSNRKGASSYCLLWPVISAVQVYLRAGWSLGNVQDRYIIAGAGADQLVGRRAVSGLHINSSEFSTLPPHFIGDTLEKLADIGWNNILPG